MSINKYKIKLKKISVEILWETYSKRHDREPQGNISSSQLLSSSDIRYTDAVKVDVQARGKNISGFFF